MKEKYKFLPHTADIKIRAYGKTIDNAFENISFAISEFLSGGSKIKKIKIKKIQIEGHDKESLLYRFIEELLYLYDADKFILFGSKVKINANQLKAEIYGDDAFNYKNLDQIKAATYHDMYIKKISTGWEIQAVLDV